MVIISVNYVCLSMFTPDLHNKIPALKIFARGWVAQWDLTLCRTKCAIERSALVVVVVVVVEVVVVVVVIIMVVIIVVIKKKFMIRAQHNTAARRQNDERQ